MCTDWAREYRLPRVAQMRQLAGFVLVSGVYDLRPIRSSYVNDACRMDDDVASAASPALLPPAELRRLVPAGVPVIVAVGAHDSPAFKRQSRRFCETLQRHSDANATYIELDGEDHFTAMERMREEEYVLTERTRLLIGGV